MNNSFSGPISKMQFGKYRPEDVEAALDNAEAIAWGCINDATSIKKSDRNFANTILAITRATEEFDSITELVGHLQYVLDEPWAKANDLATERSSKLSNNISMSTEIYQAFLDVRELNGSSIKLNKPEDKLLKDLIIDFERNGVALPEAEKTKVKDIRTELNRLNVQFGQNAVKASDEAGLLIADISGMAGLSKEFIEKASQAAKTANKAGFWISYNQPTYVYVMSECTVRQTRQALFAVHSHRAAKTNGPIAKQILKLRQELSRMLGYKNFADYALERRMAKSGKVAADFIDDLTEKYRPKMMTEFTELQAFARQLDQDDKLKLDASDVDTGINFYYASKLMSQSVGIDEGDLKAYFNLSTVLEVMFDTLHILYGLTFVKSDQTAWHPDVQVYDIREDGKTLATVWCDWYARKGKRSGAWANVFYNADRAGNGEFLPHIGCVVANLEEPNSQGHTRLTMRDVETVWHEFGHFVHASVSSPQLKEHWAFGTKWDFVEAPSQIMENWVWQPEILKKMTKHEITGQPLSDYVLQKLMVGRVFQVGLKAMRQFCQASVDLSLHREYDPESEEGVVEYAYRQKREFLPVPVHPKEATIATFSHIFSGDYASAYYSYKWAEVIEADLFSRFVQEGILNPKTGRSYRREVLEKGCELEPDELIINFLGRPSTPDAMLKRDGIKATNSI